MNRTQSKDHRVITYEINKRFIVLFYWQNIYSKHLIWWMSSWLSEQIRKTVILITIFKKSLSCQAICFNFQSNQDSFFLSSIFSVVKTAFLPVYKNIIRFLAWHIKFEKRKSLKRDKWRINVNSVRFWKMVEFCMSQGEKKETEPIFTE